MTGRVVLIEGLDLAGKCTLVRTLQAELTRMGIPVRASCNALCSDNPIAALAEKMRRDPKAGSLETGALFLSAHLWDARHFQLPPTGTIHLQDSCWLRTLAWHQFRGTPAIPELLRTASSNLLPFDAAVFPTASLEERRRRLRQRERERPGSNDLGDQAVAIDPDAFARHEAMLQHITVSLVNAEVLDTTAMALVQVAAAAMQVLGLAASSSER